MSDLQAKVDEAMARFNALSPEEQAAHRADQRASWVRGEMAMGDEGTRTTLRPPMPPADDTATLIGRLRERYTRTVARLGRFTNYNMDDAALDEEAATALEARHRENERLREAELPEEPTDDVLDAITTALREKTDIYMDGSEVVHGDAPRHIYSAVRAALNGGPER